MHTQCGYLKHHWFCWFLKLTITHHYSNSNFECADLLHLQYFKRKQTSFRLLKYDVLNRVVAKSQSFLWQLAPYVYPTSFDWSYDHCFCYTRLDSKNVCCNMETTCKSCVLKNSWMLCFLSASDSNGHIQPWEMCVSMDEGYRQKISLKWLMPLLTRHLYNGVQLMQ